jgi:hypothetical protein
LARFATRATTVLCGGASLLSEGKMFVSNDIREKQARQPSGKWLPSVRYSSVRKEGSRSLLRGNRRLDFPIQLSVLGGFGQLHDYFA